RPALRGAAGCFRTRRSSDLDTSDAAGYVALLRRLRDREDETVYAPLFRRDIEEPIACAVPVPADAPVVVTEGNYLLVSDGAWAGVRPLLDECWYVDTDEQARRERLAARHERFGRTPEQAWERTLGSDERNAVVVRATRHRADLVLDAGPRGPPPPRPALAQRITFPSRFPASPDVAVARSRCSSRKGPSAPPAAKARR